MEVVTIEKRTFSYVCERFTEFAKRIESLCSTHTQKVENWLDSQEVCLLLGFSKRTLQYYRSSGRLAYSQIGSKIYYKSSDIERIIADSETQNQSPKQITPYEKPAGIGSTEFVFTGLFAGIVGTGIAGSASLLYRFATFVFPFLIGVVVVITRKIRERRAMENL